MRILPLLLASLSACQSSPSVSEELAALRQELQEIKKANQPELEAVEAMDDLAREVKQLRQMITSPPAPPAPPAVVPGLPIKAGELTGSVGGTQGGINDLYWVLGTIQLNGEARTVLCQYRAMPGSGGIQLTGVRMLNADFQLVEYNKSGPNTPSVQEILKALEKQKK